MPIGPAYGPRSEGRLLSYLSAAYLDDGVPIVDGVGVWSWPQVSPREWSALEQVAGCW